MLTAPERNPKGDCQVSVDSSTPAAPKRILLLGAGFSTRNLGVWALASSAIASALYSFPGARIRLLDYSREPATYSVKRAGGTVPIELVNLRFSKKALLPNNVARLLLTALFLRLVPSKELRNQVIAANPCLSAIAQADLIGSIAGGDSFSDIYGLGRLLYVALPQILVLLLGKPLVLLPQTLGPFKSLPAKAIARYILSHAEVVYSRDHESLAGMQTIVRTDSSRFRFSYDMAFALEAVAPLEGKLAHLHDLLRWRPLIGVNVSGLLYMGGYGGGNMFGLKPDYRDLIRRIILHFTSLNAHVLLIPHVFGTGPNSESDAAASAEIYGQLAHECAGRLHLLQGEYDHHEIKHVIGQCDFFVGSRMHACIAALSQCVPAVGLAYSRKFRGVLGSVGVADLVIDLSEQSIQEVRKHVQDIYSRRHHVRTQLEQKMPGIRNSVMNLFSDANQNRTSLHSRANPL